MTEHRLPVTLTREYMALQSHANKLAEDNRMLLLRIDQLKWEVEKLKDQVEMLSLDLGVKNESLHPE